MSLLSVYCGRLQLEKGGGVCPSGSCLPLHTLSSSSLLASPASRAGFTRPVGADSGLSALRDAEGRSSMGRPMVRLSPGLGKLALGNTELQDPPPSLPSCLALLAEKLRAFKRNSGVSVLAKLLKRPCLSVSVYRARPSPSSVSKASPAFYKQ